LRFSPVPVQFWKFFNSSVLGSQKSVENRTEPNFGNPTPHRQVRVVGITEDHGLLRTIPERSETRRFESIVEYVDLQPDGNSFDLMANLIKSKT